MSDPNNPDSAVDEPATGDAPAEPLTKPSVEQPSPPTPGGEAEEAIALEPPIDDEGGQLEE